jgi:hypothetical protein
MAPTLLAAPPAEDALVTDSATVRLPHPELRDVLLRLALREEEEALAEAARARYWEPLPASVAARRLCADRLRQVVADLA